MLMTRGNNQLFNEVFGWEKSHKGLASYEFELTLATTTLPLEL